MYSKLESHHKPCSPAAAPSAQTLSSDFLHNKHCQQDLCQSCAGGVNSSRGTCTSTCTAVECSNPVRLIGESQSMAACLAAIVRQDPSSYAHVTSSRSTPHQACHVISSHDPPWPTSLPGWSVYFRTGCADIAW